MIKIPSISPVLSFSFIAFISLFSLASAFTAEVYFKLEPCILCIYQRYPFAIGLALGLFGLALRKNKKTCQALLSICGISFLINSVIAFYHTGVEQHWWKSAVDGCAVPLFEDNTNKSILENIMSAPLGNCSEIPWQDPIIGLSMANYNIALCFGLFLFCIFSAIKIKHQAP